MSLSDDIRRVQVKVAEIAAKEMEVVDEAIFGYIQRVADEEGVEIDVQMNRDFIVKALQNHRERAKKHEWISARDRLPEKGKRVLVYWDDGFDIGEYVGGEVGDDVYWMPLPEPPENE